MEKLGKAAVMTEDILADRKLCVSDPGDELLLARNENQLVRIQEMLLLIGGLNVIDGATVWKMCKVERVWKK